MTPRQKTRMTIALAVCVGAAATVALTVAALRENMLFFYTPSQMAAAGKPAPGRVFRLGGLVGEVWRGGGDLEIRFSVTDGARTATVSYSGVLPDLFREGQGVVVRGEWKEEAGMVVAEEVLAKHDENYMPPEVREGLRAVGVPAQR